MIYASPFASQSYFVLAMVYEGWIWMMMMNNGYDMNVEWMCLDGAGFEKKTEKSEVMKRINEMISAERF